MSEFEPVTAAPAQMPAEAASEVDEPADQQESDVEAAASGAQSVDVAARSADDGAPDGEAPAETPSAADHETAGPETDHAETGDRAEGVRTGHPEADAVLESLDGLDERPVQEHVAVFEKAHEDLRSALTQAHGDAAS